MVRRQTALRLTATRQAPKRSSGASCGLRQRAAAARTLSGSTAVAVPGHPDRLTLHFGVKQLRQMYTLAGIMFVWQGETLIKIAVVDIAAPIDRNQISAHDVLEVGIEMRPPQQIEVALELPVRDQNCAEALDRDVGKRVEMVENNLVSLSQHAPVILL